MTLPSFFDPARVGTVYGPDVRQVVEAANEANVRPSSEDKQRVLLLLVDPQVDFVHADGSLSVPGAVDDTRRVVAWLFEHLGEVTDIAVSLDSHMPLHIFYPGWWVDEDGEHPGAMTPITAEAVDTGHWTPTYEIEWSRQYVRQLEDSAKKTLMIWPYHTMIGTVGHAITPALYEAIVFHSEARRSEPTYLVKGRIPKTEHYSIFEPEVKVPDNHEGGVDTRLLDRIAGYDLIYVAGQAKSHCVLETVASVVNYASVKPGLIEKLRLLNDCMSSVAHPEIDFEAMANARFEEFAREGLQRVTTDDPLA